MNVLVGVVNQLAAHTRRDHTVHNRDGVLKRRHGTLLPRDQYHRDSDVS